MGLKIIICIFFIVHYVLFIYLLNLLNFILAINLLIIPFITSQRLSMDKTK